MPLLYRLCALVLSASMLTYGLDQGNSWDKVRYNGGTLQTKVDPKDWDNHLTVTSDLITLKLNDGQQVDIPAKSVTGLSYGQEAHRRVGTMVALGILVTPLALFGLMHKTRLHFIGIEYQTSEGKGAGLLLQGDKDNYRAILVALQSATGAPLSVSEKDREFVPGMPNIKVVGDKEENQAATQPATPQTGTVSIQSTPDAANVSVDGNAMGQTPASLKLSAGTHKITVTKDGYANWTHTVTVSGGSEVALNAVMFQQ